MLIRMALTSEEALMTPALIAMLESLPLEAGKQVAKIMMILASKAVPDDGAWCRVIRYKLHAVENWRNLSAA
jgi:hypothetical protein